MWAVAPEGLVATTLTTRLPQPAGTLAVKEPPGPVKKPAALVWVLASTSVTAMAIALPEAVIPPTCTVRFPPADPAGAADVSWSDVWPGACVR